MFALWSPASRDYAENIDTASDMPVAQYSKQTWWGGIGLNSVDNLLEERERESISYQL